MIEPKIITKNNLFDLELTKNDIKKDNTGEALITTRLFTKPWWGGPDGGSNFEDVATGIIDNDTRQNLTAALDDLAKDLPLDDLNFKVSLTTQNIAVQAGWKVKGITNHAQYFSEGHS